MISRIRACCRQIEKEEKVKIIFAIESGSRLWRMSSKDSDYDVRFVFVQPIQNYISVDNEKATNRVINKLSGKIDLSGFDIFKFTKLLMNSNPSMIEWMQADLLYYGKKPVKLQNLALNNYDPATLYHHYKSLCQFNYQKYLASKKEITYKKYLYAFRGLVNAKYVLTTGKLPPISFPDCLQQAQKFIPYHIIKALKQIITLKQKGQEKEIIQNLSACDRYIDEFLHEQEEIKASQQITKEKINKELQRIVLKKAYN